LSIVPRIQLQPRRFSVAFFLKRQKEKDRTSSGKRKNKKEKKGDNMSQLKETAKETYQEISDLVNEWESAVQRVQQTENELEIRQGELKRAIRQLGEMVTPCDVKTDENFSIWLGDEILEVEVKVKVNALGRHSYNVKWRGK
jgi:chromosome segregation ATPase